MTGTVRWRECVETMGALGITHYYEIGAGKVLSGLVKRIAKDAHAMPVGTAAEVEAMMVQLNKV